jgi:hypothetical protein
VKIRDLDTIYAEIKKAKSKDELMKVMTYEEAIYYAHILAVAGYVYNTLKEFDIIK